MIYAKDAHEISDKNSTGRKESVFLAILDDITSLIVEQAEAGEYQFVYEFTNADEYTEFGIPVNDKLKEFGYTTLLNGNNKVSISW